MGKYIFVSVWEWWQLSPAWSPPTCCVHRPVSWASTRPSWTTTRRPWRRRRNAATPTSSSRRSLRWVQSTPAELLDQFGRTRCWPECFYHTENGFVWCTDKIWPPLKDIPISLCGHYTQGFSSNSAIVSFCIHANNRNVNQPLIIINM